MKKLVVLLFLLFFSISAFAQDKSLSTENFSLIKEPGSNDRGFLSLKDLFPANYLFFTQNKKHPRKHQTFQAFSSLQFSDRAPLSRIATVEDGRQNWGDMYNLIYGQQENISSEEESESLAFGYLKRFAERNKKSRKTGGTVALVGGPVLFFIGYGLLSSSDEGGGDYLFEGIGEAFGGLLLMGTGVGSVVGGTLVLAIPSRAEREFDNALQISDLAQRERASHDALSLLAARGRRNRIRGGILMAACSVVSLAALSNESLEYPLRTYAYAYMVGGAALAVISFVVKSPGEKTFEDYLKERKREQRKELKFRLGIMPHGGVKVGFVYSF